MKRIYSILILALCCVSAFAQLTESELNNKFGAIRADMVKHACKIANYKEDTTLAKIQNKNIFAFYEDLESQSAKNNKIKTFKIIIGNANANNNLGSTNISVYKSRITKFKDELIKGLLSNYAKKKDDINKLDTDFAEKIDKLVVDCQAKNKELAEVKAKKEQQEADSAAAEKKKEEAAKADKEKEAADKAAADKLAKEQAEAQKTAKVQAIKDKAAADKKIENEYQAKLERIAKSSADSAEQARLREEAKKQLDEALAQQQAYYKDQLQIIAEKHDKQLDTIKTIVIAIAAVLIVLLLLLLFLKNKKQNKVEQTVSNQPQYELLKPDPTVITTQTPPAPTVNPVPPVMPQSPKTPVSMENTAFSKDADEWIVVGASVTGNGHIATKTPCQDSHKYEYLGDDWGIAVISDGAGSAANSHIGSKIVAERAVAHLKNLIVGRNWIKKNELPAETEWSQIAFSMLKAVRNDLEQFAKAKGMELKSLYATAIVVVHTPKGILATHIGDGRAGYRNQKGEWKALITPHKGEEANQTIFVPSDFWDIPAYKMSDVLVPESVVVKEKPFAFTLMSDGCENTSWLYNQQDEKGKFFDPNKPYLNFFNPLDETLQSFRKNNVDEQVRADKWKKFIESGNPSFVKETDDKTMILGVVYM